ncbi:hypothetical protein M0Q50_01590 [bacterium]|jgi:hypothetical protein|nr:hypothetical protein [bacterium]
MKSKNITIDELAMMVQKGFSEAAKENGKRFDRIEKKLDRIEKIVVPNHEERIERLERKIEKIDELLLN